MIKGWEERNQTDLRKLAALLTKILDVVKECGGNAMVKYDAQGDKLVILKVDGEKKLPRYLYSKWDHKDDSEAETATDHGTGAESVVKPVDGVETKADAKSIVAGLEDTKVQEKETTVQEKGTKVQEKDTKGRQGSAAICQKS